MDDALLDAARRELLGFGTTQSAASEQETGRVVHLVPASTIEPMETQ